MSAAAGKHQTPTLTPDVVEAVLELQRCLKNDAESQRQVRIIEEHGRVVPLAISRTASDARRLLVQARAMLDEALT